MLSKRSPDNLRDLFGDSAAMHFEHKRQGENA